MYLIFLWRLGAFFSRLELHLNVGVKWSFSPLGQIRASRCMVFIGITAEVERTEGSIHIPLYTKLWGFQTEQRRSSTSAGSASHPLSSVNGITPVRVPSSLLDRQKWSILRVGQGWAGLGSSDLQAALMAGFGPGHECSRSSAVPQSLTSLDYSVSFSSSLPVRCSLKRKSPPKLLDLFIYF